MSVDVDVNLVELLGQLKRRPTAQRIKDAESALGCAAAWGLFSIAEQKAIVLDVLSGSSPERAIRNARKRRRTGRQPHKTLSDCNAIADGIFGNGEAQAPLYINSSSGPVRGVDVVATRSAAPGYQLVRAPRDPDEAQAADHNDQRP